MRHKGDSMSIIECIKSKWCDAVVSHCSEGGCKLIFAGLRNYAILKGEKICKGHKICDHIIFVGNDLVTIVIVEFKSRNAHPREIEKKLVNCSIAALNILENLGDLPRYEFCHIVIVKSWRPHEYRKIVNMNFTIKGKKYSIIPKAKKVVLSELTSWIE